MSRAADKTAYAYAEAKTRYRRPTSLPLGSPNEREIRAFVAGALWASLPDPEGGCACDGHEEVHGPGHVEYLLEFNPACPEHSDMIYDPKAGVWGLRTEVRHGEG